MAATAEMRSHSRAWALGCGAAWGDTAEVPWREARAWQNQGHGGWTKSFHLENNSTVSKNRCKGGQDWGLQGASSMAQLFQLLQGSLIEVCGCALHLSHVVEVIDHHGLLARLAVTTP